MQKYKLSKLHIVLLFSIIAGGTITLASLGVSSYIKSNSDLEHVRVIPPGTLLYRALVNDIVSNEYITISGSGAVNGLIFYPVIVTDSEFAEYLNLTVKELYLSNNTGKIILENNTLWGNTKTNIAFRGFESKTWYVRIHPIDLEAFPGLLDKIIEHSIRSFTFGI